MNHDTIDMYTYLYISNNLINSMGIYVLFLLKNILVLVFVILELIIKLMYIYTYYTFLKCMYIINIKYTYLTMFDYYE